MLRAIPIRKPEQVERLRYLRNLTSSGFANFNGVISESQQHAWWSLMTMQGRVQAWLYATDRGIVVGFGLLRQTEDERWWTTCGVDPDFRGKNYGKQIMADLIRKAPSPPWSTARRDNPAAVRLHVPSDWLLIGGDDPRLCYFRAFRGRLGTATYEPARVVV